MNTIMNDTSLNTPDQVRVFLDGASTVRFSFATTAACYVWIDQTLVRFDYSRAELARQITRQRVSGRVQRQGPNSLRLSKSICGRTIFSRWKKAIISWHQR